MPSEDPQIGVPFNLKIWKKYTNQTKTGAALSFFFKSEGFRRLDSAVKNLLQNPTEVNKEEVRRAFEAWKETKRRKSSQSTSESAAVNTSRNVEHFLENLDEWLKGIDPTDITAKDYVTIEQMHNNGWEQTVGNLRVKRVKVNPAGQQAIRNEVQRQRDEYKKNKKTVKSEIKEHVTAATSDVRNWLRKQVGLEPKDDEGLEDEKFEFDEATKKFLEQCIGQLLTELAEDMVPFWGAAKTGRLLLWEARKLGKTAAQNSVEFNMPPERDVDFVQDAMNQCYQRLLRYQGVTVATLTTKAAVQAASAAGSFGTLDAAFGATASATAAYIKLRQLGGMLSQARKECGQANSILQNITSSAGLKRDTVRNIVFACPILGCHLLKDMSSSFLLDDFILANENIRFRHYALGEKLPYIDALREKARYICDNSVIVLEKFEAQTTTVEQLTAGKGLENFRRLVNKQIEKRRGILRKWPTVVGAIMAANEEAIDELIDEPKPDPEKTRKLDDLARSMGQAADEYEQTFQRYKFASKFLRNRTEQSMGCFNYLRGGFQRDIERAKNNLADDSMYLIPQRVIEFLLSNNAGQGVKNDASRKGFSGDIVNLDPLRKGSDMQKILSKHYNNWKARI